MVQLNPPFLGQLSFYHLFFVCILGHILWKVILPELQFCSVRLHPRSFLSHSDSSWSSSPPGRASPCAPSWCGCSGCSSCCLCAGRSDRSTALQHWGKQVEWQEQGRESYLWVVIWFARALLLLVLYSQWGQLNLKMPAWVFLQSCIWSNRMYPCPHSSHLQ